MPETQLLAGVTIVDLTHVLAGPYATMVLANLGARVIKVEPPGSGDDARAFGPFVHDVSLYFTSVNAGKQSIALNLKDANDRLVFERLLERADIVTENYRPGTMEKLGYGWDDLHARHPSIAPFEVFRTQDRPIVIAAGNDHLFGLLCQAVGQPGLAQNPRYATNARRFAHADALKADLETALAARTPAGPASARDPGGAGRRVTSQRRGISTQ